jgi:hypothetical protein
MTYLDFSMTTIRTLTFPALTTLLLFCGSSSTSKADEVFVKIHQVAGNRIAVTIESGGGGQSGNANANSDPQAASSNGSARRGRGKFGGKAEAMSDQTILEVPADTKITSAMRERRTFEFRVGAELPGGLKNEVFQDLKSPLSARIITEDGKLTEINVITEQTDINQSNTYSNGAAVIAVRPKRPPTKK